MRLRSRFRTLAGSFVTGAFAVGTLVVAAEARAGTSADETRKPATDARMVDVDGSAATDGAIDVHPARWSIAPRRSSPGFVAAALAEISPGFTERASTVLRRLPFC